MRSISRYLLALFVSLSTILLAAATAAPGPGAQAVLENAKELDLTEKQVAEVKEVMRQSIAEYQRVSRAERGQPGMRDKLTEVRANAQKDALAILEAHQLRIWEGLASGTDASADQIARNSLTIPSIEELRNPPSRGAFGPSTAITETNPHPVEGDAYVILTDHEDSLAEQALGRLAHGRDGSILKTPSLGNLYEDSREFSRLQQELRDRNPRFVAIAPRPESYRENMHLCILRLLAGLDPDPELDVFPGYLIASNSKRLSELVDRSLDYRPIPSTEVEPVSIGVIEDKGTTRYRSYQKAKVIQKMFASDGKESPALIISTGKEHSDRDDFPSLPATEGNITMISNQPRETFETFPPDAAAALNSNNLLFMFGHGTPGRICGTAASAYAEIDFSNEIVFCGACMSASPYQADRVDLSDKKEKKRFAYHAIDNGAVMVLAHMGLCGGFPKVYPMAELVLDGLPAGEAYQRLINALIADRPIPDYYAEPAPKRPPQRDPNNNLLYILWGDPSLIHYRP